MNVPTLHVGCPMWAQRAWVGSFLPVGTVPGRELAPYSRYVNAVEGNTTFYALPHPATIARWAEMAHPDFRFVFKVPRTVTHDRRLRDSGDELRGFVALLEPLGPLVGGLTLQLPPSFGPRDVDALDRVLTDAPKVWPWSVEVRHHEFFGGDGRRSLERILHRHDAERVVLDTLTLFHRTPYTEPGREEWRTKPRLPLLAEPLTERPIVRFIGSDHTDLTDEGVHRWAPQLADWLHDGRSPTLFVHTPDNTRSPGLARRLHSEVAAMRPGLPSLPEPYPIPLPAQASLF